MNNSMGFFLREQIIKMGVANDHDDERLSLAAKIIGSIINLSWSQIRLPCLGNPGAQVDGSLFIFALIVKVSGTVMDGC